MKGTFKKESAEFQMFGDFYSIVKEYWNPENTLEYHEKVIGELNAFGKKYGVQSSKKPQKDQVAIMAQKLAFAMSDYITDAMNRA